VLARLDEIPGVAESRVDWTGKRFLLTLEGDAAKSWVGEQASGALGEGARLLDGDEVHAVLDSYRKGETWMRAGETLKLSRFEAGVLAKRYGGEAGAELRLDEDATQKLVALFEQEFTRAFERTHAGKGIEAVPAEFEAAARRILEPSARFLSSEQQTALAEYLKRFVDARTR
jgi:hypothetical protein